MWKNDKENDRGRRRIRGRKRRERERERQEKQILEHKMGKNVEILTKLDATAKTYAQIETTFG